MPYGHRAIGEAVAGEVVRFEGAGDALLLVNKTGSSG